MEKGHLKIITELSTFLHAVCWEKQEQNIKMINCK